MRSNKRSFQQKLGTLSQRCPLIAQVNVIAFTPAQWKTHGFEIDSLTIFYNKVAGN